MGGGHIVGRPQPGRNARFRLAEEPFAKARARRESERRALIDDLTERLLGRDAGKDLTVTAADLTDDGLASWGAQR